MIKLSDWEKRLSNFVSQNLNQPFEWGKRDCTTFAIDCIESMTGKQYEKPEYTYTNMEEAIEFSKTVSLFDEMKKQVDAFEIQPNFQTVGDIIFCQEKEGYPCIYVCLGSRSVTVAPDYGVRAVPTKLVLKSVPIDNIKILRFI